jgi:hypothetical protein
VNWSTQLRFLDFEFCCNINFFKKNHACPTYIIEREKIKRDEITDVKIDEKEERREGKRKRKRKELKTERRIKKKRSSSLSLSLLPSPIPKLALARGEGGGGAPKKKRGTSEKKKGTSEKRKVHLVPFPRAKIQGSRLMAQVDCHSHSHSHSHFRKG